MPKKCIEIEKIELFRKHCNDLLTEAIPQSVKKTICTMVESLLMAANMYNGFNNNYWMSRGESTSGYGEWLAAGSPAFPEKNKFIIGHEGDANKNNDEWVGTIEGEYSRTYFKQGFVA